MVLDFILVRQQHLVDVLVKLVQVLGKVVEQREKSVDFLKIDLPIHSLEHSQVLFLIDRKKVKQVS